MGEGFREFGVTPEAFQTQVKRLTSTYGPMAYPEERLTLLWREVQAFDVAWFRKTIDDLIGRCRQPPLLPDFAEAIAIERERMAAQEKKERTVTMRDIERFSDEDKKTMIKTIVARMNDAVPDSDWAGFVKMIRSVR